PPRADGVRRRPGPARARRGGRRARRDRLGGARRAAHGRASLTVPRPVDPDGERAEEREVRAGPWPGGPDTWPRGPHPQGPPGATRRDARCDPELLAHGDRRNVVDACRYWTVEAVVADLDARRDPARALHVAIENWAHDLNIGSVVRTANAFNAAGGHGG